MITGFMPVVRNVSANPSDCQVDFLTAKRSLVWFLAWGTFCMESASCMLFFLSFFLWLPPTSKGRLIGCLRWCEWLYVTPRPSLTLQPVYWHLLRNLKKITNDWIRIRIIARHRQRQESCCRLFVFMGNGEVSLQMASWIVTIWARIHMSLVFDASEAQILSASNQHWSHCHVRKLRYVYEL